MEGKQLRKEAFLVLPKDSAYQLKSVHIRSIIDKEIFDTIKLYRDCGYSINCFAEDMLAVRLLHNDDKICWYTTLGLADKKFLLSNVTDYPEEYHNIKMNDGFKAYITEALRKYKPKQLAEFKGDEIAYNGDRLSKINHRIRYVTNKVLEFQNNIIYFDANNSYCNIVKPAMGDGKSITIVNLNAGFKSYFYGGILLREEEFKKIIGS